MQRIKSIKNKLSRFIAKTCKAFAKLKTAPSTLKWFAIIWFLGSFGMLFMPFIMPFYKQNHLNNAQILLLQSIFMLVSVIAEIPTGVIADKYGKRLSLILGNLAFGIGTLSYFVGHSFTAFVLAEILMGIGQALYSGADEALFYDTLKTLGYEKYTNFFVAFSDNINIIGFFVSNLLGMYLVKLISIRFTLFASIIFLGLEVLVYLKIPEPRVKGKEEFVPDYLGIIKQSLSLFKRQPQLVFYVVLGVLLSLTAYWSGFWTLQSLFATIGLPTAMFAGLEIIKNVLELLLNSVWPFLYKKWKALKLIIVNQTLAYFLLIGGFFVWILTRHVVISALIMSLGSLLFKNARGYLFKDMQELIPSEIRATVNSFSSLLRYLTIGLLNPLVGYLADKNLIAVQFGLPLIFISLSFILIATRFKNKKIEK